MEELQVVVRQEPGTISWNFDQLKAALSAEMDKYSSLVYTDDSIKDAKATVAMLRKLRTSVETRRKDIKNKCLEPYAIIETQAKELTALIDKPIGLIDGQVKAYDNERKEKVRAEILSLMDEKFAELPGGIIEKLKAKTYDSRWENATATRAAWQEAIEQALKETRGDLLVLRDIEDDFKERAMATYSTNLVLSEALTKVSELRKQKEEILENERRRREAEERKRLEEAQRKAYEAEHAAQAANTPAQEQTTANLSNHADTQERTVQEPVNAVQTQAHEPEQATKQEEHTIVFKVTGTKDQLNRCYAFIKSSGARFQWKEEV